MRSAARRRGAYGREYLRARLCLRARGRRRKTKKSSQTREKKLHMRQQAKTKADQKSARLVRS
jgi:hypothetical protein